MTQMNIHKASYTDVVLTARNLKSEHGENPEYDRGMVELIIDTFGVGPMMEDARSAVERDVGIVKGDGLAEAIEWWADQDPDEYDPHVESMADAARRVLEGEQWNVCEVHRTAWVNSDECPLAHHETPKRPCSIVTVRIVREGVGDE